MHIRQLAQIVLLSPKARHLGSAAQTDAQQALRSFSIHRPKPCEQLASRVPFNEKLCKPRFPPIFNGSNIDFNKGAIIVWAAPECAICCLPVWVAMVPVCAKANRNVANVRTKPSKVHEIFSTLFLAFMPEAGLAVGARTGGLAIRIRLNIRSRTPCRRRHAEAKTHLL
jgi:hypothetical protein